MHTINKEVMADLEEIKRLKSQLARLMFKRLLSLDEYDKRYVDLMMDDKDVEDDI